MAWQRPGLAGHVPGQSTVFVLLILHEREANGLTYSRCPANTDDLAMPLFGITRLSADFAAFFPSRYGVSSDTGRVLFLAGLLHPAQAHRGGAGDTSSGPPNLFRERGPTRSFSFTFLGCIFMLFLFFRFPVHCLDSMSEHLGRMISNAFGKCREILRRL